MEDIDWVAGKLNNSLSFDGTNEYVSFGNIAAFERTDSFSVDFWLNTSVTDGSQHGVVAKWGLGTGWMIYVKNDEINFYLCNSDVGIKEIGRASCRERV